MAWYRYPLPQGGWEWRYVVTTFPATAQTALTWGRRRFTIEHFFKAMKVEFSLGQFGQREGAPLFCAPLLAYLLAHWVRMEGEGSWREVRVLLPDLLVQVLFQELHAMGFRAAGGRG